MAPFLTNSETFGRLDPNLEAYFIGAAKAFPTIGIFPTVPPTTLAPIDPIFPPKAIPETKLKPVVLIPLSTA